MAKKRELRSPNDYPLLGYRVMPHIKDSVSERLEEVRVLYNKTLEPNQKPFKKNDIFIMALEQGLNHLKKVKK